MSSQSFSPGPTPNTVRNAKGEVQVVPVGWHLLPPGDAALTRRVKAAGDHWVVSEKKGRKVFSRGVWAPKGTIEKIRAELESERSTESFAKKQEASAKRREKIQAEYVEDFTAAVESFLDFHPTHQAIGRRFAKLVSDHATPVGSGTVARTKRIPVEQRAEAAVIAWMRHQTTGYDSMVIPESKGSVEKFVACWLNAPMSYFIDIVGENRFSRNARSGNHFGFAMQYKCRSLRRSKRSPRKTGEASISSSRRLLATICSSSPCLRTSVVPLRSVT